MPGDYGVSKTLEKSTELEELQWQCSLLWELLYSEHCVSLLSAGRFNVSKLAVVEPWWSERKEQLRYHLGF